MKKSACVAALVAASCAVSAAPEIIDLGQPTAPFSAEVFAVNPTGTAAIVYAGTRSFLWVEGDGYTEIPPLPGGGVVIAYDMSDDATIVVGASNGKPFRWTAETGTVELPIQGGSGAAYGISNDGQVIIGENGPRAMRWTMSGGEALPNPFPSNFALALGCDADGDTVVGIVAITAGGSSTRAMRWTPEEGMHHLGVLDTATFSRAHAVSGDGLVVTGYSQSNSPAGPKMFRWTAETGMVSLGTVIGTTSQGHAINADGSVIVGESSGGAVWTEATGIVSLRDYLLLHETPGLEPWLNFGPVRAVSPDGTVMGGSASTDTVFGTAIIVRGLAGKKEPCTGDANGDNIVNFTDLNAILAAFGQTGAPGTIPTDFNGDGVVNFTDLNTLLAAFGSTCED